jgi:hypothetical protein
VVHQARVLNTQRRGGYLDETWVLHQKPFQSILAQKASGSLSCCLLGR